MYSLTGFFFASSKCSSIATVLVALAAGVGLTGCGCPAFFHAFWASGQRAIPTPPFFFVLQGMPFEMKRQPSTSISVLSFCHVSWIIITVGFFCLSIHCAMQSFFAVCVALYPWTFWVTSWIVFHLLICFLVCFFSIRTRFALDSSGLLYLYF